MKKLLESFLWEFPCKTVGKFLSKSLQDFLKTLLEDLKKNIQKNCCVSEGIHKNFPYGSNFKTVFEGIPGEMSKRNHERTPREVVGVISGRISGRFLRTNHLEDQQKIF